MSVSYNVRWTAFPRNWLLEVFDVSDSPFSFIFLGSHGSKLSVNLKGDFQEFRSWLDEFILYFDSVQWQTVLTFLDRLPG